MEKNNTAIPFDRRDTVFIRFLAIILIVNAHMGEFYPIENLATGGAIGNSLFFILSSFGLYLSFQNRPMDFSSWIGRRITRIFPSVWIVMITLIAPLKILQGKLTVATSMSFLGDFWWPPFWFLQALLIYYPVSYFIIRNFNIKKAIYASIPIISIYLYYYFYLLDLHKFSLESLPFKLFFYFLMMVFGIIIANNNDKIKFSGKIDVFFFVVLILLIYLHKFLMTKNILNTFQIIQQLLLFPTIFYFFKICRSKFVLYKIMDSQFLTAGIFFISSITLEIYIVHVAISPVVLGMPLTFPLNVFVFIFSTLLLSSFVKYTTGFIIKRM